MNLSELSAQAHYQIEAMALTLQKAARDQDTDALPFLVQSIANRIGELNGELMSIASGVSEGPEALHSLHKAVFGCLQEVTA
jgi:hypothetical protein